MSVVDKVIYLSKMNKFEKAHTKLGNYKREINSIILECEDELSKFKGVYNETDSLQGDVIDMFYKCSSDEAMKIKELLDALKTKSTTIVKKEGEALSKYLEYKRKYEASDTETLW